MTKKALKLLCHFKQDGTGRGSGGGGCEDWPGLLVSSMEDLDSLLPVLSTAVISRPDWSCLTGRSAPEYRDAISISVQTGGSPSVD